MNDKLYIGIDSGTQGTKAVLISGKTGNVIAASYAAYELTENERGGREQHPHIWIVACRKVLKEVLADPTVDPAKVRAIGVSGQQHGMVPLGENGEVIRPAKLWCDTETTDQCATITARAGGEVNVLDAIGNRVAAGFTASKILWLKENEPENYNRLTTVLLPHEYINFWLTGEKKAECGDASGTAYFNVANRSWSDPLLEAIDPSGKLPGCLPELMESSVPCGNLHRTVADALGLSVDVLVSAGGGDNMMAAIGTGNVKPGIITASLGTSGTIYAYSDVPVIDKEGELAAFCSSTGGWLPLVCTMNVTVATELFRELLGVSLAEMNEFVAATQPGAGGLLLLPYFNGERTPALPLATATITGMTGMNMRPDLFCRAAMEGATYGLRYGLDVVKRNGIEPREIRLTGGGAKSNQWRQLVADIFDCEVVGLAQEEAGAVGAALQALWCDQQDSGENTTIEEIASRFVTVDESTRKSPDLTNVQLYQEIYNHYLAFNEQMVPLVREMGN